VNYAVAVLGFPTDSNSSFKPGPAKAPPLIRRELWSEQGNPFAESGLNLKTPGAMIDVGDVVLGEDEGDRQIIESAVAAQLDQGRFVLSLGGDHSITYPIVRAYSARYPDLSIVHFDAHPDLYPSFEGNRYSHACPFARILEETNVRGLVQIGIRTMSSRQQEVADRHGVRVFGPADLDAARDALPGGPVYVTLDLDGLDPAFAPGVSHREPGGLSTRDVLELVKKIPGTVVGADVVELNPDEDVAGMTATVAAKFAKEWIARMVADAALLATRGRK
jgi:agmatinase